MRTVNISIGDSDVQTLRDIFKNEPDFKPQSKEDRLIIAILQQIVDNTRDVEAIAFDVSTKEMPGQKFVTD